MPFTGKSSCETPSRQWYYVLARRVHFPSEMYKLLPVLSLNLTAKVIDLSYFLPQMILLSSQGHFGLKPFHSFNVKMNYSLHLHEPDFARQTLQ